MGELTDKKNYTNVKVSDYKGNCSLIPRIPLAMTSLGMRLVNTGNEIALIPVYHERYYYMQRTHEK